MFVPDIPFDFKSLVFLPDTKLDMFKKLDDLKNWGAVLQGKVSAIKPLTEHDFNIIESAIKAKSDKIKFCVVAPKNRIFKFQQELARPSFKRLADFGCDFVPYEDVEEEWRNMKKQKSDRFR